MNVTPEKGKLNLKELEYKDKICYYVIEDNIIWIMGIFKNYDKEQR